MRHHWEISWTTLKPLTPDDVERSVAAIARLGCSTTELAVEAIDERYVAVRHRENDEFLLEFGFAETAPKCNPTPDTHRHGLAEGGHIAWNWCCTAREQPETGLLIRKFRQMQTLTGDKLLVWDDDGLAHWSWGSCPVEQSGLDPMAIVDAHLRELHPAEEFRARAS